jgi:hypothetical protein
MLYPNCTPEFRIVVMQDGVEELQVRYINMMQGYTSKWQKIPKIYESNSVTTTA